jgi:hypothetical protein
MRARLLIILGCAWLFAAAAVGIATVSLVDESGWSELPLFGWLALAGVFGVAPLALAYGTFRWVARPE